MDGIRDCVKRDEPPQDKYRMPSQMKYQDYLHFLNIHTYTQTVTHTHMHTHNMKFIFPYSPFLQWYLPTKNTIPDMAVFQNGGKDKHSKT